MAEILDSLKCTHLILRFALDSVETKEMNTQLGVLLCKLTSTILEILKQCLNFNNTGTTIWVFRVNPNYFFDFV